MPIAARFITIAEPPKLTNGSGIPVTGASPIVMPTLTKIWNSSTNAIAPATMAENASLADGDDLDRAPDHEQVEQQQDRRADEAALLGERGEHEVRRVLGQVVEVRLGRVLDAAAAQAAGARRP